MSTLPKKNCQRFGIDIPRVLHARARAKLETLTAEDERWRKMKMKRFVELFVGRLFEDLILGKMDDLIDEMDKRKK